MGAGASTKAEAADLAKGKGIEFTDAIWDELEKDGEGKVPRRTRSGVVASRRCGRVAPP